MTEDFRRGRGRGEPDDTPPDRLAELRDAVSDVANARAVASRRRTLTRTDLGNTAAAPLWMAIIEHTQAIGFERYQEFMNGVLAPREPRGATGTTAERFDSYVRNRGLDPYQLVKIATEAFLLREAGVWEFRDVGRIPNEPSSPHLRRLLAERALPGEEFPAGDEPLPSASRTDVDGLDGPATRGEARDRLRTLFSERSSYLDEIIPTFAPDLRRDWSPFAAWRADLQVAPPLIELLWSYWHEEGMLPQTLNAIALRFQNVYGGRGGDRLGELAFDALRPLNSILFSYVNDETNRLSVLRRAYEYNQQYGLALVGRATRGLRPADARSQFVEAFHNLLRLCAIFDDEDRDTTVQSDGFPVLHALKEVHHILAEGAHNQFRDLPWTARVEMMVEQWIMARPEMREFLRGRYMVPYVEGWMGGVDAMKRLQGWTDVSVTHFRDLAVYGERLLLTIRHYRWVAVDDQEEARTWARVFRPEIQGYVHAYRAVTGVDLSNRDVVDATLPALHLQRRLAEQRRTQSRPYARQQYLRAPRPGTVVAAEEGRLIAPPTPVTNVAQVVRQIPAGSNGAGANGDGMGP